jgi:hypothetical protein
MLSADHVRIISLAFRLSIPRHKTIESEIRRPVVDLISRNLICARTK